MISANNISFDIATKNDTSANTQDNSSVEMKNKNTEEEIKTKEIEDPSGFFSLLGHVLSNSHQNNEPDSPTTGEKSDKNTEDLKETDISTQLSYPLVLNPELIQSELLQPKTVNALQNEADLEPGTSSFSVNHAVAWIDSDSFQSLESAEIKAGSSQLSDTQEKIDNPIGSGQDTGDGGASDKGFLDIAFTEDTLPAYVAKNSSEKQFSEDFMQTLKAPVGLGGKDVEKTNLAQKTNDITSILENSQANRQENLLPNQANNTTSQAKSLAIPVSINNPSWADAFAEQISWLGQQEIKSAVIKINPEELGPLEINVTVDKDSAFVNIVSHSSHVRDIVDQAIPKLRDMMAEQGLNLSDVQVNSDQNSSQFSQQNNNQEQGGADSNDEEVTLVTTIKKRHHGLIDYFA